MSRLLVSTCLVLLLSISAAAEDGIWLGLDAPGEDLRIRDSLPLVAVAGRAGAQREGRLEVVLLLDVSDSTLLPSGADVDGDGVAEAIGCFSPPGPPPAAGWLPPEPACPGWGDTTRAAETTAARRLVETLHPELTRVGLVSFRGSATARASLGSSRVALYRALDDLLAETKSRGHGTNFGAAIVAALELLAAEPAPEQPVQRVILLLSDGQPTLPGFAGKPQREARKAALRAKAESVRIDTIALGAQQSKELRVYSAIASITGGRFTRVEHPGSIVAELPRLRLAEVAAVEMQNLTSGRRGRAVRTFADGSFDGFLPLEPGANRIRVSARTPAGLETSIERVVHFSPGQAGSGGRRDPDELLRTLRARTSETEGLLELRVESGQRKKLEVRTEGADRGELSSPTPQTR